MAEHWDLPNTGIFYSKDVASVKSESESESEFNLLFSLVNKELFLDKTFQYFVSKGH
jgi:hypothetical protein